MHRYMYIYRCICAYMRMTYISLKKQINTTHTDTDTDTDTDTHIYMYMYICIYTDAHVHVCGTFRNTGWRRSIGCLKLQVIFRKRATNSRALLRKMTCTYVLCVIHCVCLTMFNVLPHNFECIVS